ncbi:MAG: heavy metal-binding domain-containing protein [Singulisphaera sp.]
MFVVVGGWETLSGYWARLTAVATSTATISSDTEYFCPMDPGVLSDWPSKCPICNMTLVRHKRGEATPLPDGVVARMQFTPYRLWLGGIRTGSVAYAPLARQVEAPGTVATASIDRAEVEAHFFASELVWVEVGGSAEVRPLGERSSMPRPARVKDVPPRPVAPGESGRVVVEVTGGTEGLRVGDHVRVGVRYPIERIEPFRSLPTVPPPLSRGAPATLFLHGACGRRPRCAGALSARSGRTHGPRTRCQPTRALVVPDASRGDGRPPGIDVRCVRRDGPRPPRHLLSTSG